MLDLLFAIGYVIDAIFSFLTLLDGLFGMCRAIKRVGGFLFLPPSPKRAKPEWFDWFVIVFLLLLSGVVAVALI